MTMIVCDDHYPYDSSADNTTSFYGIYILYLHACTAPIGLKKQAVHKSMSPKAPRKLFQKSRDHKKITLPGGLSLGLPSLLTFLCKIIAHWPDNQTSWLVTTSWISSTSAGAQMSTRKLGSTMPFSPWALLWNIRFFNSRKFWNTLIVMNAHLVVAKPIGDTGYKRGGWLGECMQLNSVHLHFFYFFVTFALWHYLFSASSFYIAHALDWFI